MRQPMSKSLYSIIQPMIEPMSKSFKVYTANDRANVQKFQYVSCPFPCFFLNENTFVFELGSDAPVHGIEYFHWVVMWQPLSKCHIR